MSIFDVEADFEAPLGKALEVIDETEEEESHRPIEGIFSYGADYTVDGLVKRVRDRSYDIPRFQRKDIWSSVQKSRFIESLLLNLPVPGIFVAEDPGIFISKENLDKEGGEQFRYIVIDGQQRLLALRQFCDTEIEKGKRLRLIGVQAPWEKKYFEDLSIDDRRQLDNSIIHTTIIKQVEPKNGDAILEVFHRLNTGGNLLSPQEIRVAVSFNHEMSEFLESINENEDWRYIYGNQNKRMKDQELILRFWALYEEYEEYRDPMRGFLDNFYKKASFLSAGKRREFVRTFSNVFSSAIKTIRSELDRKAFRPERTINAAVFDSIMVGIAKRLDFGEIKSRGEIEAAYDNLMRNEGYRNACLVGTSKIDKVKARITAAVGAFKNIR